MADITKIGSALPGPQLPRTEQVKPKPENSFESVIKEAVGKVSQMQNDVEKAIQELGAGGDITSAMIAAEKADMSFQLMVEVRNKLLNAYEEIMRMQV